MFFFEGGRGPGANNSTGLRDLLMAGRLYAHQAAEAVRRGVLELCAQCGENLCPEEPLAKATQERHPVGVIEGSRLKIGDQRYLLAPHRPDQQRGTGHSVFERLRERSLGSNLARRGERRGDEEGSRGVVGVVVPASRRASSRPLEDRLVLKITATAREHGRSCPKRPGNMHLREARSAQSGVQVNV